MHYMINSIECIYIFSGIYSRRLTFKDILKHATVDPNSNLVVENRIVSLVYFRAGYRDIDLPDGVTSNNKLGFMESKRID